MSGVGERDDAPEFEEVVDGEEHGADATDTDEGGDDEVGEEPDERAESDGEEDAAGADEGQASRPDQVAAKPRSAATIAVQEAKRAAKEAKAEAEATRREIAELRAAQNGRQTEQQASLERERLALMAPEEKYEYLLQKQAEQTRTEVGALRFQMQDASDRSGFESLCARNPAFEAVRDEVESGLAKMRNGGGNTTRENLAIYLIGKRAIERAAKGGKTKQAAKGATNVQRQTVKAPAARGDVAGGDGRRSGSEASARKARIENLEI